MVKTQPKGIYLAAIVFFAAGLLSFAVLLSLIFAAMGMEPGLSMSNLKWLLPGYVVGLCLVLYGVAMLVRLRPWTVWVMCAMTLFLAFPLLTSEARDSSAYSATRIYINRVLVLLPMFASSAYLVRLLLRSKSS
jgi:hypothetical protein